MSDWKGWVVSDVALFFERPLGSEHVGLFMQRGNTVYQMGVFYSEEAAREVELWLDTAIYAVGAANRELTQMLVQVQQRG